MTSTPQDSPSDGVAVRLSEEDALPILREAEIAGGYLIQWGSNYTFLVRLDAGPGKFLQAVYKPMRGERPLHDFPGGSLYKREYAAYLFSRSLGWPSIPLTLIREGPHGVGSMQLYVDADPNLTYFDLLDDNRDELLRYAVFDVIANNADRKAGHCLLDGAGRIWSIDHGLTFHADFKLRTVMVELWGATIPRPSLADLEGILDKIESKSELSEELRKLLTDGEMAALRRRTEALLKVAAIPKLDPHHNVPWPMV